MCVQGVSVLPPTRADRLRKQEGFSLSAVNGTSIVTYGTRSLTLNFGLRRTYRWLFIIADVHKPLLGADFLHQFGLLVDVAKGKLVDKETCLSVHGILAQDTPPSLTLPTHTSSQAYSTLLSEFPDFTQVRNYNESPVKHDITHHITRSGSPVSCRARLVSLVRSSKLVARNLSTCSNWELSIPHQVTDRLP